VDSIRSDPVRYNDKHGTSPETPDLIKLLYDPTAPCQSPSLTMVGHEQNILLGLLESLVPGLTIRLFQRLNWSDPSSRSDQKCIAYKHMFLDYLQLFCVLQLNIA